MLGHVDVVQRNNIEDVDVFLAISFQLQDSTGPLVLSRGIRDWGDLVLQTNVRGQLAQEACRFDR